MSMRPLLLFRVPLSSALAVLAFATTRCPGLDEALVSRAERGLRRAVRYLTAEVAVSGGYAGSYLTDLSKSWGEGSLRPTTNWVQPPGTPSTGFAFFRAWEATGDGFYLRAATRVAECLARGQLACGGWDYVIGHGAYADERWFFRRNRDSEEKTAKSGYNRAILDDNVTQHATRLLIALDRALGYKNGAIHEAALAALDLIVAAQHPSGGWPQRFPLSGRDFRDFLTLNDHTVRDCCDVMMIGLRTYGDPRFRRAVIRCADFLVAAQLPEPHPVWAQQYDFDLKPAWARPYEPPAACSLESMPILSLLMDIAIAVDDARYLDPIPRALDWYGRSALPDGRYARYYELKTNRPLYFALSAKGEYLLTYADSNLPVHYGFKVGSYPTEIEKRHKQICAKGLRRYREESASQKLTPAKCRTRAEAMETTVARILDEQDRRGRWITQPDGGQPKLLMSVFQDWIRALSDYLELARRASIHK